MNSMRPGARAITVGLHPKIALQRVINFSRMEGSGLGAVRFSGDSPCLPLTNTSNK